MAHPPVLPRHVQSLTAPAGHGRTVLVHVPGAGPRVVTPDQAAAGILDSGWNLVRTRATLVDAGLIESHDGHLRSPRVSGGPTLNSVCTEVATSWDTPLPDLLAALTTNPHSPALRGRQA
ncbi:hypothetical protein D5S17_35450 [Pseudonocardiaceae bacterium YIM PH 21723]|nr:hypothetical protein D5S17_35450 [Pseudonocardiaceae bacterium YIM PH 21723]